MAKSGDTPEVTTFMPAPSGTRLSSFTTPDGLTVTVTPSYDPGKNDRARALAEFLANWSKAFPQEVS